MAFLDSVDGLIMLGHYDWALISALQKLYYNLVITSVSSIFAVVIALIEILGIVASYVDVHGPFWAFIGGASDNFGFIGLGIVVAFLFGWAAAAAIYDGGGYGRLATGNLSCTQDADPHSSEPDANINQASTVLP